MQEHELEYEEVVAVIRTTTRRGKAPAIYRNPTNPRQTWSGKGEAPEWFKTTQSRKSSGSPAPEPYAGSPVVHRLA